MRQTGRALQAKRLRLWIKADGKCAMCGKVVAYPDGFHLDHRQALVNGGADTDANSQVLCITPCHEIKTAADMGHKPTVECDTDGWPRVGGAKSLPE